MLFCILKFHHIDVAKWRWICTEIIFFSSFVLFACLSHVFTGKIVTLMFYSLSFSRIYLLLSILFIYVSEFIWMTAKQFNLPFEILSKIEITITNYPKDRPDYLQIFFFLFFLCFYSSWYIYTYIISLNIHLRQRLL